jgi:glyoxylate carboligase
MDAVVKEIKDALQWAVQASEERRVPALVEIMCEREVNAAMGLSIEQINEYEPILDGSWPGRSWAGSRRGIELS